MKIIVNGCVPLDALPSLLDRGLAHLLGPNPMPPELALGNVVLHFDLIKAAEPHTPQLFHYSRVGYEPSLTLDVLQIAPPNVEEEVPVPCAQSQEQESPEELVEFLAELNMGIPSLPDWVNEPGTRGTSFRLSTYDWYRLKKITTLETYRRRKELDVPRSEAKMSLQALIEEGINLALAKRGLSPLRGRLDIEKDAGVN